MTTKVNGTIGAVNDNFGKVNINVDGAWYSTKREWWKGPEPEVGMVVSFDNGGKNYIKYFTVSSGGGGSAPAASGGATSAPVKAPMGRTFPVGVEAPERTINRQNALTNAVNYAKSLEEGASVDDVIEIARSFEGYTCGDIDLEMAKAALAEMGGS